jgi:ferredoxin like protein
MVNLIRDFIQRQSKETPQVSQPELNEQPGNPKVIIQEKVDTVRFNIHKEPHITLDTEVCKTCDTTACVYVCPANLFNIVNGEMLFVYDNCFECGTCYVACGNQAIHWSYPQGGYGVSFRQA